MVKALFDTNILIDHLNRSDEARKELARYDDRAISIVTWMEVLVGAAAPVEAATRAFLQDSQSWLSTMPSQNVL
jgi:predicted nucleic acid-binding protein